MTPRKKGQQPITQKMIVDAALELIDEFGLEGHTMRQLGDKLGVDASSLYYHISSQAALYDLVAERIMAGIDLTDTPATARPVDLVVWAGRRYFDALTKHPHALPLITECPVRSLDSSSSLDALLGVLLDTGLDAADTLSAVGAISWFVLGAAQNYAAQIARPKDAEDASSERLQRLVLTELPSMARMPTEVAVRSFDEELEHGLHALAQGLLADY